MRPIRLKGSDVQVQNFSIICLTIGVMLSSYLERSPCIWMPRYLKDNVNWRRDLCRYSVGKGGPMGNAGGSSHPI